MQSIVFHFHLFFIFNREVLDILDNNIHHDAIPCKKTVLSFARLKKGIMDNHSVQKYVEKIEQARVGKKMRSKWINV